MKRILAIEIKDNKTVVTLTKFINGKHNLLLHETYDSKPLKKQEVYDFEIIKSIKNDLKKRNLFDSINESILTLNTRCVAVQTFNHEIKYNTDIKLEEEKITQKLNNKYPEYELLSLIFSDTESSLVTKTISVSIELVNKDNLQLIKNQFKLEGIEFSRVISVTKAIENSIKNQGYEKTSTFSILVEEKFTQSTLLIDGIVSESHRWNLGLTNIYEHISNEMGIDRASAKTLFTSYGSIPPEDVIDDKIISSIKLGKEIRVFTKKDLSRIITEKVNELFSNVKGKVDPIKNKEGNIRIVFSGEIKSLIGFKKYASKSFAENNIEKFSSDTIGLTESTEFITTGILHSVINTDNSIKEELNVPRISAFNKILRMYNYI